MVNETPAISRRERNESVVERKIGRLDSICKNYEARILSFREKKSIFLYDLSFFD